MPSSDLFADVYPRLSGEQAFQHYEHVRVHLPSAEFPSTSGQAPNLIAIADKFDVFVFDAYGVLNVGNTPVEGANACIEELRLLGKKIFVLSNGASFSANVSVKKFNGLGFDFLAKEIVSSRIAAERALAAFGEDILWGAMSKADYHPREIAQPSVKLADDSHVYDQVTGFLLLSTLDWTAERQQMLEQSMTKKLRPVLVANPDIVSPREDHFGMEPGYIGHRLIERFGADVVFYGKPFQSVYDIIDERLGDEAQKCRICMIGDTLHTDILGGAAHGWQTVLVRDHGMFKGLDVEQYTKRSGIVPHWVIPAI